MDSQYEKLTPYLEQRMALQAAMVLLEWDMETLAPEGGGERTARVMGVLTDQMRQLTLDPEVKALVKELKQCEVPKCGEKKSSDLSGRTSLTRAQKAIVDKVQEDIDDLECIPADEYRAYAELQATATGAWAKAKKANDFEQFAPKLKEILSYVRKFAGYQAKKEQELYDVLLDDYEKGFSMKELDAFFAQLKNVIGPLVEKAKERKDQIDDAFLSGDFPVEKQREFNEFLLDYLGFDRSRGVMAESAHPFTTNLHKDDVRMTTHYYPEMIASAIFSTIHECGHALYEQGIGDEISQTPVGEGASCGMHESQSRFYENMIGRSAAFWKPIYGKLQKTFPEQLGEVSLEQFIQAINKAYPSLIRTESDELTYCIHIMIRYELEKQLINGELEVEDLQEKWDDLYEEYLGIRPENASEGVLQDIHWAQGSFGYFPSYALGNAFAAQIAHKMEEELDVEQLLEEGKICKITEWLRERIHRHGAVIPTRELLKQVTGEDFDPRYYIEYLQKKFG